MPAFIFCIEGRHPIGIETSEIEALTQCWPSVGPPSATLTQH